MMGVIDSLLVGSIAGPAAGSLIGLILNVVQPASRRDTGSVPVKVGIFSGFLCAAILACLLGRDGTASCSLGHWLTLAGSRRLQIDWGLQADLSTSSWIAVLSGLMLMTVISFDRSTDESPAAFSLSASLVLTATVGFLLSSSLVQTMICWTSLSLLILLLAGWTASTNAAVQGIRRAIQAGIPGDLLLLWIVIWIGQVGGISQFTELASADQLNRLGTGNPAFPGLIGCLLVLGVLGRCGLFPCFGWHIEAASWNARLCFVMYGICYVPSGIWMLLKCHPLLMTTDVALSLLGGLGALSAVLSAFVACGQAERHRRLAYLASAQTAVMLVGLGSGLDDAVGTCVFHQCVLAFAVYILFACATSIGLRGNYHRAAMWWAACSIGGVLPFSGGWSQQELVELNAHPVTWVVTNSDDDSGVEPMLAVAPEISLERIPPRWGWICGLWIGQGLSAYAVARAIRSGAVLEGESTRDSTEIEPAVNKSVILAAVLLLIAGPCGWLLGVIRFPSDTDALIRLVVGQLAGVAGLIAGWQSRTAAVSARWDSMVRLSEQRFYVDQMAQRIFGPISLAKELADRKLGIVSFDRMWTWTTVRLSAWLGLQVESLHVERVDFYLAALLLSTLTVLLTIILVS